MPADTISRTDVYHALKLDKDVHIPMRDGAYVVADVFRPDTDGQFPISAGSPQLAGVRRVGLSARRGLTLRS